MFEKCNVYRHVWQKSVACMSNGNNDYCIVQQVSQTANIDYFLTVHNLLLYTFLLLLSIDVYFMSSCYCTFLHTQQQK